MKSGFFSGFLKKAYQRTIYARMSGVFKFHCHHSNTQKCTVSGFVEGKIFAPKFHIFFFGFAGAL